MTLVSRSTVIASVSGLLVALLISLSACADRADPASTSADPSPPAGAASEQPAPTAAPPSTSRAGTDRGVRTAGIRATSILAAWDAARERAYARGSLGDLTALYRTPRLAAPDRRLLAAYAARGLRVTGMRRQVHEVRVRDCGRLRCSVIVRDRLAAARVRAQGNAWEQDLPSSRFRWREITFVRGSAGWVVAAIRPGRP